MCVRTSLMRRKLRSRRPRLIDSSQQGLASFDLPVFTSLPEHTDIVLLNPCCSTVPNFPEGALATSSWLCLPPLASSVAGCKP